MSKFLRALLLAGAATGVAALVLYQIDLEAARDDLGDAPPGFPGMDPEDMGEEDVAMLLNELASQL
jgi:hypothetical protein